MPYVNALYHFEDMICICYKHLSFAVGAVGAVARSLVATIQVHALLDVEDGVVEVVHDEAWPVKARSFLGARSMASSPACNIYICTKLGSYFLIYFNM